MKSFEVELIDKASRRHVIVFGCELGKRSGWDLSATARSQLGKVYLHLKDERNREPQSCLGQPRQPHIKSAKIVVHGEPGAAVTVHMIRPFDLTRAGVQTHIENARAWNLLPIASTNHGGASSWSALDPWNFPYEHRDEATGHRFRLERPGLAATPGSPSYCADLVSDFGLLFHNQTGGDDPSAQEILGTSQNMLKVWTRSDGKNMYLSRRWAFESTKEYPDVTSHYEHFENLGGSIVRYLTRYEKFGQHWTLYTHCNQYNPDAFAPPAPDFVYMSNMRRLHPYLEQALATLSCLKYDLDGRRAFHQRVWCCPLSVALRFAQAQRGLSDHARLEGNEVRVTAWRDEVTRQAFPDPKFLSQDLHGQTFYVPDAATARVFCGEQEITSLRRNPPDFTGRPSVSIVDTETPTIVFDEIPLDQAGGDVSAHNARLSYPEERAARGRRCMEIRSAAGGESAVVCQPRRFDNHETDFVRLFYRKSNPESEATFSWSDAGGREYVVTEGSLQGRQGWQISPHVGQGYREVVLEYADMRSPAAGAKTIPRGVIRQFAFGLSKARPGDTVVFDRVEFLAARGLRPSAGDGLVVGGRLSNQQDGVHVEARGAGQVWETRTAHGGWYFLRGIPRESVVEISCETAGRKHWPERGRLCQIGRNDLEYHIVIGPKSP